MDEKKQQELAGLLGMIGTGAGIVGGLAGTGSLISNTLGQNRTIDQRFQNRIMDGTRKFSVSSLNPQQKAAVKRLTGMDVSAFPGYTPISELPVNINNKTYKLSEIIFDKTMGITAKLPKDAGGLRIREAINQLVVPVQQTVLSEAQTKVKNRQTIKNVASQHVAEGGLLPRADKAYGNFDMVGERGNAAALRQGALGSTAPTSSLITNEGFGEGPKTSFNEIAQRLPAGHPSATTGSRMPIGIADPVQIQGPPALPESSMLPPRARQGMPTQSNNFTGPETYPERQAAYREASRELRPTGLKALMPKVRVPGTGMQAVKAGARNMVRGIARAPIGAKIGTGVTLGGGALSMLANNYAADKIVEGIEAEQNIPPGAQKASASVQGMPKPSEFEQSVLDMFDSKYSGLSQEAKINEAKRIVASPNASYRATANLWLKYNAPNK